MNKIIRIVIGLLISNSALSLKTVDAFSKEDISCELRLKETTVKEGYPVEVELTVYNKSEIPVTIGHSFHIFGPEKVMIKQGGMWVDMQRFFANYFIDGDPYSYTRVQSGGKVHLDAFITERYKRLSLGTTQLKIQTHIYPIVDAPGFGVEENPILCSIETDLRVIECNPEVRKADQDKLIQDILKETDEKTREALIKRLISFTCKETAFAIAQLWDSDDSRIKNDMTMSLLSFDSFDADKVFIMLPGINPIYLLSQRDSEWIARLIKEIPESDDVNRNKLLDRLKAEMAKNGKLEETQKGAATSD